MGELKNGKGELLYRLKMGQLQKLIKNGHSWTMEHLNNWIFSKKLDGVGPVNNRPSTDKLHHFVH